MAGAQPYFSMSDLINIVASATTNAKNQITAMQNRGSAISIGDMFNMQMLMNNLSQLSEMCTSVVSSANTSIMSMARNLKG